MATLATFRKKPGRPTDRPSEQELLEKYKKYNSRQIAAQYGVTPSAVRGWIYYYRQLHKAEQGEAV